MHPSLPLGLTNYIKEGKILGKVIVVTSGKGGVGKTTVTANLGVALALTGKRVLMIDTDTGLRNLDILLGFEDRALYDVVDVLSGNAESDDAFIQHEVIKSLYMLPASQTKEKEELDMEKFKDFCLAQKKRFDYILIDCPAGIEYGFRCALYPADEAIIVAVPDKAAIRDADRVAGLIEDGFPNVTETHLLINRLIPELADKGKTAGAEETLLTVSVKLIGIIPEDPRVLINAYDSKLCVTDRKSKAGKAIKNIAKRLNGENVKLYNIGKKRLFKKKY